MAAPKRCVCRAVSVGLQGQFWATGRALCNGQNRRRPERNRLSFSICGAAASAIVFESIINTRHWLAPEPSIMRLFLSEKLAPGSPGGFHLMDGRRRAFPDDPARWLSGQAGRF